MTKRYWPTLDLETIGWSAAEVNHELATTVTDPGGSSFADLASVGVANGTSAPLYAWNSPSGEPNDGVAANWSGTFAYSLNCQAAGANMSYGYVLGAGVGRLVRASSTLSTPEDAGTLGTMQTGTGIKTESGAIDLGDVNVVDASDRFGGEVRGTNGNSMMSTETITIRVNHSDTWIEGPWSAAPVDPPPATRRYARRVLQAVARAGSW